MHRFSHLLIVVLVLVFVGAGWVSAQVPPEYPDYWNFPDGDLRSFSRIPQSQSGGGTSSGSGFSLAGFAGDYYDPGTQPPNGAANAPGISFGAPGSAAQAVAPAAQPPQDSPPFIEPWFTTKILEDRVYRDRILKQAIGGERRRNGIVYADVFYHDWEAWGVDGNTVGINPSVTFGDKAEYALIVPLYVVESDYLDDTLFSIGVDGSLRLSFLDDMLSVGAHAYYLVLTPQDDAFKDEASLNMAGGGPFVSLHLKLSQALSVSLGVLYEFTDPENGDTVEELAPGASLNIRLSDTMVAELYFVIYMNQDDDPAQDDTYADVGGNVRIGSESWGIIIGGKTTTGHDDVDSVEGYFGTEHRF